MPHVPLRLTSPLPPAPPSPIDPLVAPRPPRRLTLGADWLNVQSALGWELRGSGFDELGRAARMGVAAAVVGGPHCFGALLAAPELLVVPRAGLAEVSRRHERRALTAEDLCRVGRALEASFGAGRDSEEEQAGRMLRAAGMSPLPAASESAIDALGRLAPGEAFLARPSLLVRRSSSHDLVLVFRERRGRLGLFDPDAEGLPICRVEHRRFADLLSHRSARVALGAKFHPRSPEQAAAA